jgi:hypothetical protein
MQPLPEAPSPSWKPQILNLQERADKADSSGRRDTTIARSQGRELVVALDEQNPPQFVTEAVLGFWAGHQLMGQQLTGQ